MRRHKTSQRRAVFRIGVAGALLDAEVDGVPRCSLVDGNSEGFAIVTNASFRAGADVQVVLRYDGQTFAGRARIRNVQELRNGKFRYGLQTGAGEQMLRRGLRYIVISVQRERLRRAASRRSDRH